MENVLLQNKKIDWPNFKVDQNDSQKVINQRVNNIKVNQRNSVFLCVSV